MSSVDTINKTMSRISNDEAVVRALASKGIHVGSAVFTLAIPHVSGLVKIDLSACKPDMAFNMMLHQVYFAGRDAGKAEVQSELRAAVKDFLGE